MEKEVGEYVAACPTCARNKTSSSSPMGLLHPLSIPSRPWSDISLDFVTGLPVSQGNTAVLTVVDRFSKMVHFIALPKLPSAKETMQHVFRVHGFPRDIVSDRGPQFVSRFWREFCSHWSHGEPFFWVPSPIQRADGETQPGVGDLPTLFGVPEPGLLD